MSGSARAAQKTPTNLLHFPTLRRLFPNAYLISIVRDGRDVVSSLLEMTWRDDRTGKPMAVTQSPQIATNLWAASVANDEKMAGDKRFYSLRYENLVRSPAEEIAKLFAFLGEPTPNLALYHDQSFDALEGENETSAARVAEPIDATAIGRWRSQSEYPPTYSPTRPPPSITNELVTTLSMKARSWDTSISVPG